MRVFDVEEAKHDDGKWTTKDSFSKKHRKKKIRKKTGRNQRDRREFLLGRKAGSCPRGVRDAREKTGMGVHGWKDRKKRFSSMENLDPSETREFLAPTTSMPSTTKTKVDPTAMTSYLVTCQHSSRLFIPLEIQGVNSRVHHVAGMLSFEVLERFQFLLLHGWSCSYHRHSEITRWFVKTTPLKK